MLSPTTLSTEQEIRSLNKSRVMEVLVPIVRRNIQVCIQSVQQIHDDG